MRPLLLFLALMAAAEAQGARPIAVGSKKFTESVLLGEIGRVSLESEGFPAGHRAELGGTTILWNALRAGDIDAYPEYTGTIAQEILRRDIAGFPELRSALAELGVGVLDPLGFNNTYAIGMKRELAEALGIRKISDLAAHPKLRIGWGDEFRQRKDGWPGLRARYRLPQRFVRGLDHDVAYRALASDDIHVTDLYSTDAEIQYYGLQTLEDDLSYFPRYEAVYLYRLDLEERAPRALAALARLSGKISEEAMISMNRRAKIDRTPAGAVAADFLRQALGLSVEHRAPSRWERVLVRTGEHLKLVCVSLLFAVLAAVPLGVFAEKSPAAGRGILWTAGVIQTIPALALLVVLIRPLNLLGLSGIGDTPAFLSLFLYGLLPIMRSTHAGMAQIPPALRETASVLDLSPPTRLFRVELPLALPFILSGVKTSAVMTVGFATLGALVGAGGYGQPILTGIRLDDYGLILEGAIPSALLAVVAQQLFDFVETKVVSPGLRA